MRSDHAQFQDALKTATVAVGQLLRQYRCGHPQWYAELLTACALEGLVQPTNHPRFDVLCATYGRVQVKERVIGTDSKQNRSNFGRYQCGDFDWAAIILFTENFDLERVALIRCEDVLSLVRRAGHVKWADIQGHKGVLDFTVEFRKFELVVIE